MIVQERRHICQCCGRGILANTGLIAHHGYQRPHQGWQTGSCMGARHLPFEVARDRLGDLIVAIEQHLARTREYRGKVADDAIPLPFSYSARHRYGERIEHHVDVTRDTFDMVKEAYGQEMMVRSIRYFADLKVRILQGTDREIQGLTTDLTEQRKRFDGWKQTERWTGTDWEAV